MLVSAAVGEIAIGASGFIELNILDQALFPWFHCIRQGFPFHSDSEERQKTILIPDNMDIGSKKNIILLGDKPSKLQVK
jgi:hypothetical protein